MEISPGMLKPSVGTPVPVPDAEVSPDRTIVDQRALGEMAGPALPGNGDVAVAGEMKPAADDVPPPIFQPFEKPPEIVKQVLPVYPELAIKVGLEGRVYVRVWVDKEGKPRKAIVIKSNADIFNQSAIEAAMHYRFTPAIMNKGPVSVWMVIPFVFRLKH